MIKKTRNKSFKKTLKLENKSLKKISKFQKILKSKFKNNTSATIIPKKKGKRRLQKIKLALQKSKIKNKTAILNLNKIVYKNKEITDMVNSSFSELIKSPEKFTISKFFEVYNDLFYNIPKKGEKSHESLINQSREYIDNYADPKDTTIESLIELLEKKDQELNLKQNPNPTENLFYPDGTFLRTHASNTEYVEGVPQSLPIWVMQQGMKREFTNYDVYNIVKKSLGFEQMNYNIDKKELSGQTDIEITEVLHTNELNWLPTGKDINNDNDLNFPPGPDREINLTLGDIVDYYHADITCLEGTQDLDPLAVQLSDYSDNHDHKNTCYIQRWKLDGNRRGSNRIDPGETITLYYLKDAPSGMANTNVGYMNDVAMDWSDSEEDGIFGTEGYIRFDYKYPENTPSKYINIPFSTAISVDTLPSYIEPTYSNYGTRMYDKLGYGDQKKSGKYTSGLSKDSMWGQVLSDPKNAFYNGNYDWSARGNCDGCENISGGCEKGGGYEGENKYRRIYYDHNNKFNNGDTYFSYLGKWNRTGIYADRYFYVILNKDYGGHGPLSDGRVVYVKKADHNYLKEQYTQAKGGARSFSEASKFPQDENGFYIPQEYWDEFGYI